MATNTKKRTSKTEEVKLRAEFARAQDLTRSQSEKIDLLQRSLDAAIADSTFLRGALDDTQDMIGELDSRVEELQDEVASLKEQVNSAREDASRSSGFADGSSSAMRAMFQPVIGAVCKSLESGHQNGRATGGHSSHSALDMLAALMNAHRPDGAPSFEEFAEGLGRR